MTMWFKQLLLTKNDCYKAGKKMAKVEGLMLHSTGANNPKLSRYVGPDDGNLGHNKNGNHWNNPGIQKCVHGFIGLNKHGEVETYQTLPWQHRGWHAGGSANNTHIGVEICEDGLQDPVYFQKVYAEAVKLFAHLAKCYNVPVNKIIDHSEGRKLGIASNHGDVMHWFPKHGKSMNTFRADVAKAMGSQNVSKTPTTPSPKPSQPAKKTISQLADEVMRGLHGSGRDRQRSLGANYTAVQQEVNRRLKARK